MSSLRLDVLSTAKMIKPKAMPISKPRKNATNYINSLFIIVFPPQSQNPFP